jgi:ATP-binding cassette, subfamily F, member 3
VLHLEDGKATFFPGGYSDYSTRRSLHEGTGVEARARDVAPARTSVAPPAVATNTRESHEERRKKSREQERRQRRIEELERLVADGESKLKTLRAELALAPGHDWERLAEMADREQKHTRQLDAYAEEWMKLTEAADA